MITAGRDETTSAVARWEMPPGGFPTVVGELLRDVVHAIRNPLAAARNSLDLVNRGMARPEDVPVLQKITNNGIERIDRQLGVVQDLARLCEAPKARVALGAVVAAARAVTARRATARGVTVDEERVGDAAVDVEARVEPLAAALAALIDNAIDASPAGARVVVAHGPGERGAVVTVRDEGEGIAPERLRNVFRLFYTSRDGAQGLGLTLVRLVVAAHGGAISVESERGRGTTVTVRLG